MALSSKTGATWTAVPAIVDHYRLVAPIMDQIFGRIPIVWTTPNAQPNQPPVYHGRFFGHYSHLTSEHVQHLASIGAQEFHSWFPTVEDPARARFARFLLERPFDDAAGPSEDALRRAALLFKAFLEAERCAGIPVLDGVGGVSIFVPLADGPSYPDLRAWAHTVARTAIAAHPDLFSEAPNVHADGRVHIHVSSNAEGRWSILPYSARTTGTRVATPVTWEELPHVEMRGAALHEFPARLKAKGDVFGEMLARSQAKRITGTGGQTMALQYEGPAPGGYGSVTATVIDILSDGKTRSAEDIVKIAQARGQLKNLTGQKLFADLLDYIERQEGRGRKPQIIRTFDHKFRMNQPPDPWPDTIASPPGPKVDVDAIVARLQKAAKDSADSADFEVAVCDAFAALGFLATHVGGRGAPDGYADAPLGTMGYRVMLECKSGSVIQRSPDIYEAAKYRDDYHAQYCALVGAEGGTAQKEAMDEIKTHGVSLWGVDDLEFALRRNLSLLELRPAFGPGAVAQDVLSDILWSREHGVAKRVRIIAEIIRSAGWVTQCAAAEAGSQTDAPAITEDAAMLLVDQELAARGAHVNCSREEVRLAFEWLTNPMVGFATWTADRSSVVICSANGGPDKTH